MTTPVLTKKQQRHSLSAKTGPIKGLRNILAQPTQNFWPIINVNQYPELMINLNTILPSIKKSNHKIPKDMLKNLTKKDRVLARKKMLEEAPPKPDILKFIVIGINEVTRALEKDNVCSVLLDANTDPLILIKHIISMAVNKKIPVLMLPMLRTITKEKGFPSRVLALKQEVMQCPNNVCYPIYKSIAEAFKDFKLPECLLQCYKSDEVPDKSAMCKIEITEKDSDTKPNISKPEKSVAVFADVYKYRSSRDERAFVPPTINKSSQVSQTLSDNFIPSDNDFIPLNSDFDFVIDKNCASTSKNERYVNIGKKKKHTLKSKNTDENLKYKIDSTKQTKNILKRLRNEPNYLSLKIKCTQGSKKRKKATKFAKKKEKK
ncbi:RPP38 protein, partial [Acromyrmex charruanus]